MCAGHAAVTHAALLTSDHASCAQHFKASQRDTLLSYKTMKLHDNHFKAPCKQRILNTHHQCAFGRDGDVAWVRVSMEEAVLQDLDEVALSGTACNHIQVDAGCCQCLLVCDLDACEWAGSMGW